MKKVRKMIVTAATITVTTPFVTATAVPETPRMRLRSVPSTASRTRSTRW
jgi:hypothetical protein